MVKFSIIVPVYNVEKYLEDCLESILKQTYDDFEVIVVNDGSTDNSQKVIDNYAKRDNRIKAFKKKNGGVSDARNYGISKAKGEYFIFVDSDDTINDKLLEKLDKEIKKYDEIDLIKYQLQMTDKEPQLEFNTFDLLNGEEAFLELIKDDLFVSPVTYAYRLEYFRNKKFKYEVGRIHEDFGLTPLIVISANKVSAIDYVGYNYIVRENSIMTNNSNERLIKKNEDTLFFYDNMMKFIEKSNFNSYVTKIFKSYISNGLINRTVLLDGTLLKDYVNELKIRKVGNNLIDDTLPRKIKKILFKLSPSLYIKLFVK